MIAADMYHTCARHAGLAKCCCHHPDGRTTLSMQNHCWLRMQRLLELHDGDGDGVILHEEFLSALCAIRKLASGNPQERLACEHATVQPTTPLHACACQVCAGTTVHACHCSHQHISTAYPYDLFAVAFKLYDLDGDGLVSSEEMATVRSRPHLSAGWYRTTSP